MRHIYLLTMLLIGLSVPIGQSLQAAPPPERSFTQPNAYAVVIGISQYREEVIPKVAYAVRDAQTVAALLETQSGIPKSHIRLLTNAKATGNDLRSIGDWLRMRVKPDSIVYVYYAGHGTPDPKTGEAYLVPWDGHPDFPSGLYPLHELYTTLNNLATKDIVVMLDSCFSGATGRSVLAKGARPMVLSVESRFTAFKNVVVLAASTGNQISSDSEKYGHGLFTHSLLLGLLGAADADKDGMVTLSEIFPYVHDHVAQTAIDELNREQTPVLIPDDKSLGPRAVLALSMTMPGEKQNSATAGLTEAPSKERALASVQNQLDELERKFVRVPAEPSKPVEEARARPYQPPFPQNSSRLSPSLRVLVLVSEAKSTGGEIEPAAEGALIKALLNLQVSVVDPELVKKIRNTEQAKKALDGDLVSIQSLARHHNASVVILGNVSSQKAPTSEMLEKLQSVRASLSARAIRADTGETLAVEEVSASGLDLTAQVARRKAMVAVGGKWVDAIEDAIQQWQVTSNRGQTLQESSK